MEQLTEISAGGIVLREVDGTLQVVLSRVRKKPDKWVFPKGRIEANETFEQTALREIYEESGLVNIQLIKYLGVLTRMSIRKNGNVVLKVVHYFLAYAPGNGPSPTPPDTRFIEMGWFSPQQAFERVYHDEDRVFFKEHLAPLFV